MPDLSTQAVPAFATKESARATPLYRLATEEEFEKLWQQQYDQALFEALFQEGQPQYPAIQSAINRGKNIRLEVLAAYHQGLLTDSDLVFIFTMCQAHDEFGEIGYEPQYKKDNGSEEWASALNPQPHNIAKQDHFTIALSKEQIQLFLISFLTGLEGSARELFRNENIQSNMKALILKLAECLDKRNELRELLSNTDMPIPTETLYTLFSMQEAPDEANRQNMLIYWALLVNTTGSSKRYPLSERDKLIFHDFEDILAPLFVTNEEGNLECRLLIAHPVALSSLTGYEEEVSQPMFGRILPRDVRTALSIYKRPIMLAFPGVIAHNPSVHGLDCHEGALLASLHDQCFHATPSLSSLLSMDSGKACIEVIGFLCERIQYFTQHSDCCMTETMTELPLSRNLEQMEKESSLPVLFEYLMPPLFDPPGHPEFMSFEYYAMLFADMIEYKTLYITRVGEDIYTLLTETFAECLRISEYDLQRLISVEDIPRRRLGLTLFMIAMLDEIYRDYVYWPVESSSVIQDFLSLVESKHLVIRWNKNDGVMFDLVQRDTSTTLVSYRFRYTNDPRPHREYQNNNLKRIFIRDKESMAAFAKTLEKFAATLRATDVPSFLREAEKREENQVVRRPASPSRKQRGFG